MTALQYRGLAAAALTAVVAGWIASLSLAPALAHHPERPAAALFAVGIYTIGSVVCHQAAERSFHLDGIRAPVCARCTGLYLGVAAGMLAWWRVRHGRAARRLLASPLSVLAVMAVPTAFTWAAAMLGAWDAGNLTRAVAALPLGLGGGAIVTAVVSGELR